MSYKIKSVSIITLLFLQIAILVIPITFIPMAQATVSSVNSDNSGRFLGQAGSDGGACSSMAASGGGFHPNNGGTSQAGRSDGNRCYVGWWRIDLSGLPAGDSISAMTFTFPSISASGGYSEDIELRFMTSFSAGSNACSNSNNDGDTALYDDIIDSSNSTAVSTGNPTSIWSSSTIAISTAGVTIAQNQRSSATAAEDVDSLCVVAYETGGPKGGPSSGTEPVYNWASNPGIVASITHSPALNTITVQLYDSSNSTLLNFREPSVKMQGINGSSSAWTECASGTCKFTGITPDTPIRIFANFSDNIVKIDGENSYNRTCGGNCDLKLPVSVYATTNLYFYNSTGGLSAGDIVSYDIQYANSTTQTITINAASSTLRWLHNGTNSVLNTNLVSNHGLTLNATTTFNSTANGQGFSFLLDFATIVFTLNLKANDLTTDVDFQSPTARALNLNGTVSGYQACSPTCGFKVFANDETAFQVRWAGGGVLVNSSNMVNVTSATSKALLMQLSIFKSPKLIEYTNNYSLFSPTNKVVTIGSNGTEVTISDYSGGVRTLGHIGNGTNTVMQTNALGANRNNNGTITFAVTQDDQVFSFKNRIYSMSFMYKSNNQLLDITPTSHSYSLSNGTLVTQTNNFDSFYLGNTSLVSKGIEYQNSNMCKCNGTFVIAVDINALWNMQYYSTNFLGRNYVNTSIPVDNINFDLDLVNSTSVSLTSDLSGNTHFYSGNGTINNIYAVWESLIVNGTINDREIAQDNTFYIITNVVKDDANIVRWAVNNSRIQDVVSLGIQIKWWSNSTTSEIAKFELISPQYNEPQNLVLNSTIYNSPSLSWNWVEGSRILTVEIPFSSGFNSSLVIPYDPSLTNSTILRGLNPGIQNLLAGNPLMMISSMFTNIMGLWFYAIALGTITSILYLKTGSVVGAFIGLSLVTVLLGPQMSTNNSFLPPQGYIMAFLILVLLLWAIYYRLIRRVV
jgi:hypothetical protein